MRAKAEFQKTARIVIGLFRSSPHSKKSKTRNSLGAGGCNQSVHCAIEQGKLAAAAILGKPRPAEDCPWFWSDQYDLKLQIAGLSQDYDEIVVRGDPKDRKFAAFYLRNGTLIAVDAINSPPEFLASKKLIMSGAKLAPDVLGDTSISMKDIAAAALAA